jgi:predicted Zn-ribbon and HTH transcriptional regulator
MSLTVRRENLPVRCEICHQTDLFDPETGQCGRCLEFDSNLSSKMERESSIELPELNFSKKFQKNQKTLNYLLAVSQAPFIAAFVFIVATQTTDFKIFACLLGISALSILFAVHLQARFSRCPNCGFEARESQNLKSPENRCRRCGAILIS